MPVVEEWQESQYSGSKILIYFLGGGVGGPGLLVLPTSPQGCQHKPNGSLLYLVSNVEVAKRLDIISLVLHIRVSRVSKMGPDFKRKK